MYDTVKLFIHQHRNAFDAAIPDAHRWKDVQKALDRWPEADAVERTLLTDRVLLDTAEPPAGVWENIARALDEAAGHDPLERFILQNRAALDAADPRADLWSAIAPELPVAPAGGKVVTVHWGKHLLRAAAAITLLITGAGLGFWYAGQSNNDGMSMAEVSQEYAELERHYIGDISSKKEQLATFVHSKDAEVFQDLRQMDKAMEELRLELAKVPPANREQVVRAMIEHYEAKTAILQRVLEYMQQQSTDSTNTDKNETQSI